MSQSGARRAPIGRYFETTLPASSPVHRTDAVQAVEAESTSGGKVSRSTEERFWLPGRRPRRRRIQTDREREREREMGKVFWEKPPAEGNATKNEQKRAETIASRNERPADRWIGLDFHGESRKSQAVCRMEVRSRNDRGTRGMQLRSVRSDHTGCLRKVSPCLSRIRRSN
jgi:hypothetical protein